MLSVWFTVGLLLVYFGFAFGLLLVYWGKDGVLAAARWRLWGGPGLYGQAWGGVGSMGRRLMRFGEIVA